MARGCVDSTPYQLNRVAVSNGYTYLKVCQTINANIDSIVEAEMAGIDEAYEALCASEALVSA